MHDSPLRDAGRLFVVHGSIQDLIHDAALVPVDKYRDYNPVWTPLVGPDPVRPDDWDRRGWGRVHNAPARVWAVSIGGAPPDPYDVILERVRNVLARVAERRDVYPLKRRGATLPLVAVPVVGIGMGGHGSQRGDVLVQLTAHLHTWSRELDVDVALVTPESAVYAAAQYARRDLLEPLPPELDRVAKDLGERAKSGRLALMLGAGVSLPSGLPTWHELITDLAATYGVEGLDDDDVKLSDTDKAELIEKSAGDRFQHEVARIAGKKTRPSLLHALLAGLDCHEVVTTNYDTLYERAVEATRREIRSVMPWSSAHDAERWILKLHGDVDHVDGIVLTRRHMVRYDAANRPSAALVQSLLLTKRLLFVGVSMTDDNVIRLAHEVQDYRELHQKGGSGTFGTVLDVGGDLLRARLWEGQLNWVDLPRAGAGPGIRAVEIVLDRVAFHAARDSSWLLDPRFSGLIEDDRERGLADRARELFAELSPRENTKWWPLYRQLRDLGAQPDDPGVVVITGFPALLGTLGAASVDDLVDRVLDPEIDSYAEVEVARDGHVELRMSTPNGSRTLGTSLEFPTTEDEFWELVHELDDDVMGED